LKNYNVRFFQAQSGGSNEGPTVSSVLRHLIRAGAPTINLGGANFEIRHLTSEPRYFTGVFARLRQHDLPHAGRSGGGERELPLADDEGLLEKSHFFFAKRYECLLFQQNPNVGYTPKLAAYLSVAASSVIEFHPILQRDAAARLLAGTARVKEYDITIARPAVSALENPRQLSHSWNRHLFEVLRETGGYRIKMQISGDGHSTTASRFLSGSVVRSLAELGNFAEVKRARVKVQDRDGEGEVGTVDLLEDQIADTLQVEAIGRYPNSLGMWNELARAWERNLNEVRAVLGIDL